MHGFTLKKFEPSDINFQTLRAYERDYLLSLPNWERHLALISQMGSSWSIFKNGEHVSSGGVVPDLPGIGSMWQYPSVLVAKHMVSYCKVYLEMVEHILSDGPYHRLWTICPDDDLHNRWMRFISFEKEGVMRHFTPDGKDYSMFARLK